MTLLSVVQVPPQWSGLVFLIVSLTCCCSGLSVAGGANSSISRCTPRELSNGELAAWTKQHADAVSFAGGGQHRPNLLVRNRRRRDLLVSDTDCSLENLCHPLARPRVCYYNSDICDGVRDCDTGRDELYCEDCLCAFRKSTGVTMDVLDTAQRSWAGVNLQGCARACSDVDAGCVAFSFSVLRTDGQRCRILFQSGRLVAALVTDLYVRDTPSVPRLAPPVKTGTTTVAPPAAPTVNCSSLDMFSCGRGKRCLPFSQLCDGVQQCPGNEEVTCRLYLPLFSRLPGRTIDSYSSPLRAASLESCAAYCMHHSTTHPKCLFFAYRSARRECLIGCSSCGNAPTILEDASSDYYSVSPGSSLALAVALLKYGSEASPNDATWKTLRPQLQQVSESLKELGVSIPSRPLSISGSTVTPTGTTVPTPVTVQPAVIPQTSVLPNTGSAPSSSFLPNAGSASTGSFLPNAGSAPTGFGFFNAANVAPSVPGDAITPSSELAVRPSVAPARPTPALVRLPADCGRRPLAALAASDVRTRVLVSDGASNRVVSGHRATYGTYPWQAQIQVYGDSGHFEHHCGGVLIGERLVLTAAHCLTRALSRLQVKLGQHDRRDASEQHEQTFAVENALSHPGYRADPVSRDVNDLAVLKLRLRQGRPVVFSSHVQPLCLASGASPVGQSCEISGWGKTDPLLPNAASSAADVLHGGLVPIVSDSFCAADEVYGAQFVADRMVCAGHLRGGADTCQGDSGGPLACRAADGRWQVTGIVSFGEGCGGQLKPGVYTRVSYYAPWIQRVVQLL